MYFNLRKAAIYQSLKYEKYFSLVKLIKNAFLILFAITFLLFLSRVSYQSLSAGIPYNYLTVPIIALVGAIVCWEQLLFFKLKLKRPHPNLSCQLGGQAKIITKALKEPRSYNFANFLSFELAKSIRKAIIFSKRKKLSQIPSQAILYFCLKEAPEINFIFSRVLLDLKTIKTELRDCLRILKGKEFGEILSKGSQELFLEAAKIAQKRGRDIIKLEDIVVSQSGKSPILKKYLMEADLKQQDIENLALWLETLEQEIAERKRFWSQKNLARKTTLAKEWAAGYTLTLDRYGIDWTEIIKRRRFGYIVGHEKEIEELERILERLEINNVLLVGEPGSGRGSIIEALAQRILFGESLPNLNYKRVIELDMATLIAQTTGLEETEKILDIIFKEIVKAGNIILIIDDFQNYVSQAPKPGVVDISGVLLNYLHLPQFQIIATSTPAGLHRYIEQNPSILNLFAKVEVLEISPGETILVLENLTPGLEKKYKKYISYPALRDIVNYSLRYMPAIPFPKKARDLLDEVLVYVKQIAKDYVVLPKHVAKIVSDKTQIPVGKIEVKEKKVLLSLEELIHKRIINQDIAVKEVATALRRARSEVTIRKGPMGSFLFLGPTGVGKTETSKALAEVYFGSEERMIRLDMSEFQHTADIPRLIGAPGEEGLLTTKVRERPFSLILLDELEKAHPNILNLFLQVLDEGHLTDGLGRKIDFKNTIIIATSNAGYKVILKALEENLEWSGVKKKLLDYLFQEAIFRPEFINRFDAVVVFSPLSRENLLDISQLLLAKLRENMAKKDIDFVITPALKEKIVELGYSPVFGAREMQRVIQDKVENILAEGLLSGRIKKGDRIRVDPERFKLITE